MREIKFRIWIKDHFEYWGFVHDEHGVHFAGPSSHSNAPMSYFEREQKSEQFTGIQDSEGVDIYEGDIVRWNLGRGRWGDPGVVSMGLLMYGEDAEPLTGWIVEDCFVNNQCTICGNIHQHAHLLEE